MAEEQKKEEITNPNVVEAQAIAELSEENARLEKENKDLKEAKAKYYDAVLNGGKVPSGEKHRSSQEIRDEWAKTSSKNTNLRNAQLSVELDDAVRRETGESSFLPKGHDEKGVPYRPTVDEYDLADRTAETLKECLEEAGTDMATYTGGDPEKFNIALKQRRL